MSEGRAMESRRRGGAAPREGRAARMLAVGAGLLTALALAPSPGAHSRVALPGVTAVVAHADVPATSCYRTVARLVNISVGGGAWAVAVDEQTHRAFVRAGDGTVALIDTRHSVLLRTVHVAPSDSAAGYVWFGTAVAVDARTNRVFVATPSDNLNQSRGHVSVLDATTGRILHTLALGLHPTAVAVDEATGRAFVTDYDSGSVSVLDATSGRTLRTTRVGGQPNALGVDARTNRVFVTNDKTNTVALLDATTGALRRTIPVAASAVAVDAYRGRVYVAGSTPPRLGIAARLGERYTLVTLPPGAVHRRISMLDAATGRVLRTVRLPSAIPGYDEQFRTLAVDAHSGDLYVGRDAGLSVLSPTGRSRGLILDQNDTTFALGTTETGRVFAAHWASATGSGAPAPGSVDVLDVAAGQILTGMPVGIEPVAIATDEAAGRVVVVGLGPAGGQSTVSLFDEATGGPTQAQRHDPALRVPPAPVHGPAQYFCQTGHTLAAPFLAFWRRYGGLAVFGYPETEAYQEGHTAVQYTERFWLEQVGGQVRTAPLGRLLTRGRTFPRIAPFRSTATRVYFPATGHSLSGAFLDYYRGHHGALLLGAPSSEVVAETNGDGTGRRYPVQWFERGRLEDHAEARGTPYAVQLGRLGVQALQQRGWLP